MTKDQAVTRMIELSSAGQRPGTEKILRPRPCTVPPGQSAMALRVTLRVTGLQVSW